MRSVSSGFVFDSPITKGLTEIKRKPVEYSSTWTGGMNHGLTEIAMELKPSTGHQTVSFQMKIQRGN